MSPTYICDLNAPLDRISLIEDCQLLALPNKLIFGKVSILNSLQPIIAQEDMFIIKHSKLQNFSLLLFTKRRKANITAAAACAACKN